jgi:hypothetical protein
VFCAIKSGLRPPPPKVECEEGGYTDRLIFLNLTGRSTVPSCWGDPGPVVGEEQAKVLAYGRTWRFRSLRCTSAKKGLTCRNGSGHGFFLSRERSRRF